MTIVRGAKPGLARRAGGDKRMSSQRCADTMFRHAFDASPSGKLIVERTGTIMHANTMAERMFGYGPAGLVGRSLDHLVSEEFSQASSPAGGDAPDLYGVRKDGTQFPASISLTPIETGDDSVVVADITDIAERLAAREAVHRVRERTEELEAANAELEAFAYAVSHDLRGPIHAMDGTSQALSEEYGHLLDEDARVYLRRIRDGSQRMGEIIDSLLKLSRITQSELEEEHQHVDLSEIARHIVHELRLSEPDRPVRVTIDGDLVAPGNRQLLSVVLCNLIDNAWKFTARAANAQIEIGAIRKGGAPIFFVRDNGAGFDPAQADKLFQPFGRLHRADDFPGTGIGLATAARVIRRHGGHIRGESTSEGTNFYFSLGYPVRQSMRNG